MLKSLNLTNPLPYCLALVALSAITAFLICKTVHYLGPTFTRYVEAEVAKNLYAPA